MSDPAITAVFNGVKSLIANSNAGQRWFTLLPSYLPRFDVATLNADYGVVIVPRGIEVVPATRGQDQMDVSIDVGLIRPGVDGEDCSKIEGALRAVSRLNAILRVRLDTDPPASWIGRRSEPIYDVEKLQRDKLFYSVTTHTYRVIAAELEDAA